RLVARRLLLRLRRRLVDGLLGGLLARPLRRDVLEGATLEHAVERAAEIPPDGRLFCDDEGLGHRKHHSERCRVRLAVDTWPRAAQPLLPLCGLRELAGDARSVSTACRGGGTPARQRRRWPSRGAHVQLPPVA